MKQKFAVLVRFYRKERDAAEYGVGIGDDIHDLDIIVDGDGNVVLAPVWSFTAEPLEGLIRFNIPDKKVK